MIRRISGIAFAIAFLSGIVLFTRVGSEIISYKTARIIFILSGGTAMVLNLINFQQSKHSPIFTLLYWTGSIATFIGLVCYIMRWPYAMEIFIGGMALTGVSFFIPNQTQTTDSEILDDF